MRLANTLMADGDRHSTEEVGSGHVTCNFCGLSKMYIVLPIANVWRNFSTLFLVNLWPDFNNSTINRKPLQCRFCKCDLPNPSHGSLRRYCW